MTTKPRPSGASESDYAGYANWTYRRWAWEFLRRNTAFSVACKAASNAIEQQRDVAQQFHLKKFKHFSESYVGKSGAPRFVSSSVTSWSNVDDAENRKLKLALRPGHVLVKFDLGATTADREALDAQLREAAKIVLSRQKQYLRAKNLGEPKAHAAKPMYFLRCLRLLDLLDGKIAQHRDRGRALRIVNQAPNAKLQLSDAESLKDKKQIKQARDLASDGYRHLANRKGKPEPKTFK